MAKAYEFLRFAGEVETDFLRTPSLEVISRHFRPVMRKAAQRARDAARERTPVASGRLQRSIHARYSPTGLRSTVSERVEYGAPVEYGARFEGAPPARALVDWVEAKLGKSGEEAVGVAFAVAKSLAGTKQEARNIFGEAFDSTLPANVADFESVLERIAEDL